MKAIILVITFTLITLLTNGQCNCETIHRDDGITVTQCESLLIASDNITQVGMAMASNGYDKFITITIRFATTAQTISGNLIIRLVDNNLITFELVNSGLSFIGNNQVAQAVFLTNQTDIAKLEKSNINTISFSLDDGLVRTHLASSNVDVLKTQVVCL